MTRSWIENILYGAAIVVALVIVLCVVAEIACGQTLPLGAITDNGPTSCAGFQSGSTCQSLTVSCPNLPDINVTSATVAGTKGPVILPNGSGWTIPGMTGYSKTLAAAGYEVHTAAWASNWEYGAGSVLEAACRPATLLNYLAAGRTYAVLGASGGAGATAYAMSWYGLTPAYVALSSGPVFSDISQGCQTPKLPSIWVTPTNGSPWLNSLYYNAGVPAQMTNFTGQPCEPRTNTTAAEQLAWLSQSILAPGAVLYYPNTRIYVQLCATSQQPNNSAGQAYLWLQQVLSPWSLTAITGCSGSEGTQVGFTPQGTTGASAMIADLEANY